MSDRYPLILGATKCERAGVDSKGQPLVRLEVKTPDGAQNLLLTINAAHELKGLLSTGDIGPRSAPGAGMTDLSR